MENQPFRKQPIYNGNETLFLDMTFFDQFSERDDFLIGFLQYAPLRRMRIEFQLIYQCSIAVFFVYSLIIVDNEKVGIMLAFIIMFDFYNNSGSIFIKEFVTELKIKMPCLLLRVI